MYLNRNVNIEGNVAEAVDELSPLPMAGQNRHTMKSRYSYGSGTEPDKVSIARANSTSRTSESAKIGSHGIELARSTTTSFSPVTAHAEPSIKTPGASAYYEAEEINRKVSAMLAATAALEGRSPLNEPTPSKMSVMKNKVMAKMSSIWSRIHDKKPQKEAEDEKAKLVAPVLRQTRHISSPVKDTGARTVAAGSTGGHKAETVTPSYRIARKPVPSGSRVSLPAGNPGQGSPTANPFADQEVSASATGSDPMASTVRQRGVSQFGHEVVNPFNTEGDFHFHMNDLLATSPIAASTPRGSRQQKAIAGAGLGQEGQQVAYSPGPDSSSAAHASASADDEDGNLSDCSGQTVIVRKEYHKEFSDLNRRINNPSEEREGLEDAQSDTVAKVKKHPSPSKEELEELEEQFQILAPTVYNPHATDDELASIAVEIARAIPVVARHVPQRPAEASASGSASGSGQVDAQPAPAVRTVTVLPPTAWVPRGRLSRRTRRLGEPSGSQPTTENSNTNNGNHWSGLQ